ncbi:MAG: acyl-CoA synthetase [Acidimicrobiales bacterium]
MADTGFFPLAAADPDRAAVLDPAGTALTAGHLAGRAHRLAHGLRSLGLEYGDTVAVVLPNGAPFLELYLAALESGLYFTPINHHLVGAEIAYIAADSDAKVLVGHERFAAEVGKAVVELGAAAPPMFAVGAIEGFRPYAELSDGQPDTPPPDRRSGLAMHYTSGTTGQPKGVKRTLPALEADDFGALIGLFLTLFGIQPNDGNIHLTCSPLYHTAVLMFTGCSLQLGHQVVVMDKWSPEGMLEQIERHGVTTSHMVPTQFHRLLALPEDVRSRYDVSSLRAMVHAAAPCPPEIKRRMIDWWGDAIVEYYAATEGGGTVVFAKDWLEKPGTVGRAWPTSEVRILDDDGNQLGAGDIGTVYMSLASADFEYKGDKEKTESSRRDGFFTVGDIGYLDEDGYLFLCDRKSDMIISGGVNIYPAEIESAFLTHPKIADVAVFGIPHEDWGEEIKAVVEPAPGVEPGDELAAELLAFAAGKLAKYKLPRSVDFIVEMPRDPNGKLYKRRLRDPFWEGRERAI